MTDNGGRVLHHPDIEGGFHERQIGREHDTEERHQKARAIVKCEALPKPDHGVALPDHDVAVRASNRNPKATMSMDATTG